MNNEPHSDLLIPTSIIFEYDEFMLDPEDVAIIEFDLMRFAPTRTKKAHTERGANVTSLWITCSFIGLAFSAGIIDHVAIQLHDSVVSKLQNFINSKKKYHNNYEQCISLTLSFDNLEIDIILPSSIHTNIIRSIFHKIQYHLSIKPLKSKVISYVILPFTPAENKSDWHQIFSANESDFDDRYWGISSNNILRASFIYDSQLKVIIQPDPDSIE